jgi:hypothetical protein
MLRSIKTLLAVGLVLMLANAAQALDASVKAAGTVKVKKGGAVDHGLVCRNCLSTTGTGAYKNAKGGKATKQKQTGQAQTK